MWKPRFRLRSAFVLFTLICVLMGICSVADHRLKEKIRNIQRLGGRVYLNADCDDEGKLPGPFIRERPWFSRIAYLWSSRISPFRKIVNIGLNGSEVSDFDLEMLSKYSGLLRLDLSHTRISDAGLTYLSSLEQLRFVELNDTRVSKEGVRTLSQNNPALIIASDDTDLDELIELFQDVE